MIYSVYSIGLGFSGLLGYSEINFCKYMHSCENKRCKAFVRMVGMLTRRKSNPHIHTSISHGFRLVSIMMSYLYDDDVISVTYMVAVPMEVRLDAGVNGESTVMETSACVYVCVYGCMWMCAWMPAMCKLEYVHICKCTQ